MDKVASKMTFTMMMTHLATLELELELFNLVLTHFEDFLFTNSHFPYIALLTMD